MAQNDFLQFDENNENVLTQDAYREDEQRISGAKSGVARSSLFNKVLRQVSTFVAGFGQFIAEKNINILEDIDSVKNALTNVLSSKNIGVSTEVQELLGVNNVEDAVKMYIKNLEGFLRGSILYGEVNDNLNNAMVLTDMIKSYGWGLGLAYYASLKENLSLSNFPNLVKIGSTNELTASAALEIVENETLSALIKKTGIKYDVFSMAAFGKAGYTGDTVGFENLVNNSSILGTLSNNENEGWKYLFSNEYSIINFFKYRKSYDALVNKMKLLPTTLQGSINITTIASSIVTNLKNEGLVENLYSKGSGGYTWLATVDTELIYCGLATTSTGGSGGGGGTSDWYFKGDSETATQPSVPYGCPWSVFNFLETSTSGTVDIKVNRAYDGRVANSLIYNVKRPIL